VTVPGRVASDVRLIESSERYASKFRAAVDRVARERAYLILLEAPPADTTALFIRSVIEGRGVQILAVSADDDVVGWCDISRSRRAGLEHSGVLGMGLLPEYRGKGLGRKLAERAISDARARGIERIELEVIASNRRAIQLYERLGFAHEGVKRKGRKLDGAYEDLVVMALL
jgi:RimJ/RimL family protein N-acetyltransferase